MSLFDDLLHNAGKQYDKKDYGKSLILLLASEVLNNDEEIDEKKSFNILRIENLKGHCFVALEDYDSARVSFENVLKENENIAEVHAGLGMLYWNLGDAKKSLKYFERSFEINPFNKPGVIYYSKVLYSIGSISEAKSFLNNYIQIYPTDLEAINLLFEYSEVDKIKGERKDIELMLVTGIYGSGKTTYANSLSSAVLHIDEYFDYTKKKLDSDLLRIKKDYYTYCLNNKSIVLDAYTLFIDPKLDMLRDIIKPVNKIIVKFVYTSAEELYNSQRSTEERKTNLMKQELPKKEFIRWNNKEQIKLLGEFDTLFEENIIQGIDFVYRMGNTYRNTDRAHFMETIGEINDWSMNKYELISFVQKHENQPYQTIELKNEIIRPGSEQCWLSWENIEKFNIDWKNKYVCDVGSYFGYFSLQTLKKGAAKVLGIDQNETLLNVYKEVLNANGYTNVNTLPIKLGDGNVLPDEKFDVVMALNMLHHIEKNTSKENYTNVLISVFKNAREVVLEINDYQIEMIDKIAHQFSFKIVEKVKSHRNTSYGQRFLLYYIKVNDN